MPFRFEIGEIEKQEAPVSRGGVNQVGKELKPLLTDSTTKTRAAPTPGFGELLDTDLTLINISRALVFVAGLMAALAAVSTTTSLSRIRMQCVVAASAAAMSSIFYMRLYSIRNTRGWGYSREGNTASDSARYASWCVVQGLLAFLGLTIRGPLKDPLYGQTYETWLHTVPLLSSGAVLLSGSAQFAVEAAKFSTDWHRRALWIGLAICLVTSSTTSAGHVTAVLHWDAFVNGTNATRTPTEIGVGRSLGLFWVILPVVSVLKLAVILGQDMNYLEDTALAPLVDGAMAGAHGLQEAVTWTLRMVSHAHSFRPRLDANTEKVAAAIGMRPLITPVLSQIFDSVLAVCDCISVAGPAFFCAASALPVYD